MSGYASKQTRFMRKEEEEKVEQNNKDMMAEVLDALEGNLAGSAHDNIIK